MVGPRTKVIGERLDLLAGDLFQRPEHTCIMLNDLSPVHLLQTQGQGYSYFS